MASGLDEWQVWDRLCPGTETDPRHVSVVQDKQVAGIGRKYHTGD